MNISIALTTHNGREYLEKQLQSILQQTLMPIEIIVSDDGSTDGTLELLDTYRRENKIIQLLHSSAGGINNNFQNAVSACTGDFIAFCDQDDIWAKDRLTFLAAACSEKIDLIYGKSVLIDETDSELAISGEEYLGFQHYRSGHLPFYFCFSNCISGHTMMIRKTLIDHATPFPSNCMYDQWLALIASTQSEIVHVPEAITYHRIHSSNTVNNQEKNRERKARRIKPSKFERYKHRQEKDLLLLGKSTHENNTLTSLEANYLHQLLELTQKTRKQFFNIPLFFLLFRKRQELFHSNTFRECRNKAIGGKYYKFLDYFRSHS